jgi:acetyltransferase-like isoleucine patch superfamily enzyme
MRGRDKYSKYEYLVNWLVNFLKILPVGFSYLLLNVFQFTPGIIGFGMRYVAVKRLAKKCGKFVSIYPGVFFLNIDQLEIDDYVSIHQMCYLEAFGGLQIGSNAAIGHGASLISLEHDYLQRSIPMRDAKVIGKPIIVDDDVWIGAGVKVLAGVTLGKGSVIGTGAVVTKDVPEFSIAAGVPAKVISKR